jgi:rhodanese-related sulfurtransferase
MARTRLRNAVHVTIAAWIPVVAFCGTARPADETSSVQFRTLDIRERGRGPYCGIYSVCGALVAIGRPIELDELLIDKYIESPDGSSLAELQTAVHDHGGHALPMTGMNVQTLRACASPVILHVTGNQRSRAFKHWILYLGNEDGMARILDAPRRLERVPWADVLAEWDGIGLIVSDQPIEAYKLATMGWLEFAVPIAIAFLFVALVRAMRHTRHTWTNPEKSAVSECRTAARQAAFGALILVIASTAVSIAWNSLTDSGLLRNPTHIAHIAARHSSSEDFPSIASNEIDEILRAESAVIIDARYRFDYQKGHIPGALNFPVNATLADKREIFSKLAKNANIVVYCQSAACDYSEHVANELALAGYDHIHIYRDGYRDWARTPMTPFK